MCNCSFSINERKIYIKNKRKKILKSISHFLYTYMIRIYDLIEAAHLYTYINVNV